MKRRTREELNKLLQERNEYPDRAREIDERIREVFSEKGAVMVMDMSGFSRLTIKHGIIHFLAMIHRMNGIAEPVIKSHEGVVVKFEADNAFAVFPDVENAIEAAIDIIKGLNAANTMLPEELDMFGKFGIGYGDVLLIDEEDLFGAEVNLASKLGEDLAMRGEILLTEAAFSRVDRNKDDRQFDEVLMSVSGLELIVHKVKYDGQQPC